jgi:hypothetical protein
MTANHHDWELWERYFKPCKNTRGLLIVTANIVTLFSEGIWKCKLRKKTRIFPSI